MKLTVGYRKTSWLVVSLCVLAGCGEAVMEAPLDPHPHVHHEQPRAEQLLDTVAPPLRGYVQTAAAATLHAGPGASHTVLRTIPANTRVFVTSGPDAAGWYQVSSGGAQGHVDGALLKAVKAKVYQTLPTTEKVVSFTFDAGADTGYTAFILDTLKKYGIKASFGMTGKWALANPELMARIAHEGHHIFNHSFSHGSFTGFSTPTKPGLTYEERNLELWKTEDAIVKTSGVTSKPFFRPPYGDYDNSVLYDLYSRGYDYNLMWSCDSLGWKGLSVDELVQRSIDFAKPGAIYLYHVGSQSQDGPALPAIIRELSARGYRFARVSDYVPERPATTVSAARADATGNVFATVNGVERPIGFGGHQPVVVGTHAVAYLGRLPIGERQSVHVYEAHTGLTATYDFSADLAEGLSVHPTTDGRHALLARGISGARAVPVLSVFSPHVGQVFSPAGPASVSSVQGDLLTLTLWEQREGELEVSPARTETHDLRELLNQLP